MAAGRGGPVAAAARAMVAAGPGEAPADLIAGRVVLIFNEM